MEKVVDLLKKIVSNVSREHSYSLRFITILYIVWGGGQIHHVWGTRNGVLHSRHVESTIESCAAVMRPYVKLLWPLVVAAAAGDDEKGGKIRDVFKLNVFSESIRSLCC